MQSWRAEPSVDAERQALLLLREEEGDAAHGGREGSAADTARASQHLQQQRLKRISTCTGEMTQPKL